MSTNYTKKIAILGSTKGTSMQPVIEAIKNKTLNASIELVISNKKDAYILERAEKNGVTNKFISNTNKSREEFDDEISQLLHEYKVDFILLIGYMRILSSDFVDKWAYKILNVHPSLLPKFSGGMDLDVHRAVLEAKETETGCTVHYVDKGVDTGEIILQKKCSVEPNETVETLKVKVQKLEGEALVEAIQIIS